VLDVGENGLSELDTRVGALTELAAIDKVDLRWNPMAPDGSAVLTELERRGCLVYV
jgi:hypothetical protein